MYLFSIQIEVIPHEYHDIYIQYYKKELLPCYDDCGASVPIQERSSSFLAPFGALVTLESVGRVNFLAS